MAISPPLPSPSTPVSRTPRNLVAQLLPLLHDLPAGGGRIEAPGSMSPLGHSHYDMSPPLPLPMRKQDLSRTESDDVYGSCCGEMDSASTDGLVESSEGSPRLGFKLNYRPNDTEVDGKAVPLTSEKVSYFTAYSNTSPVGPSPLLPSSTSAAVQCSSKRIETSVTPGRWQKGKLLGSGTFGTVYVGFNRETGNMCAMKEVPLYPDDSRSSESIKQLEQEINLLSGLKHPNIVQYHGSETVEDLFYIYLEYVPGGSIHKVINDYGPLEEPVIRKYTRQILSGLAYLHSMNTVHRDIKGANLLVDASGRVKLTDFGVAKHINGPATPATPLSLKGSPYWMAPEVPMQKNTGHDVAVDIWSLGCTVIEMATGKPPWSEYESFAVLFKLYNGEVPLIPDSLSPEGRNFVDRCLCINPAQRPTASQLLEHPFVKNATQQDSSDLLASATSGIKSLNILHSPRDKNVYASDTTGMSPVLHSANGKQHQTRSENCYPKIGIFSAYSSPQLSPHSTIEPFSSSSPLVGAASRMPHFTEHQHRHMKDLDLDRDMKDILDRCRKDLDELIDHDELMECI